LDNFSTAVRTYQILTLLDSTPVRGPWTGICAALALLVSAPAASASWWAPPKNLSWYWQLSGAVDNSHPAAAYDIDGFDNSASEVSLLHSPGKHVICYIDIGTYEPGRPDSKQFPAGLLGNGVQGWPGERWLDVRPSGPFYATLKSIMTSRFQMCAAKHFDAVEPDNIDSFDGNDPGFPTSASDQATYNEWVAGEVHRLGMAVLQKNDPAQAGQLEPYFDGVLDEQCNEYSECSAFQPYLNAGKPVLNAEYNLPTSRFCAADSAEGIMGALDNIDLDGHTYQPCWSGSPGFGGGTRGGSVGPGASSPTTSRTDGVAPHIAIAPPKLSSRGRTVRVRLACASRQSYCDGTVVLQAAVRGHRFVLGSARFRIAGGDSRVVRITLSRKALRSLGHARSVHARVMAVARNRAGLRGSSSRSVTLKLS
jgi:hypothetical protein